MALVNLRDFVGAEGINVEGVGVDESRFSFTTPAPSRPVVPSSPRAIPGGPSIQEQEMGLFSFLGKVASVGIGIAEGVTGIDVPFVGPGDRFLSGGPAVPGGRLPLDVAGLPELQIVAPPPSSAL